MFTVNDPLSRFTCEECVEGMEFVEAYMRDPLWVAEYTLYLEQNFCVHDQVSRYYAESELSILIIRQLFRET